MQCHITCPNLQMSNLVSNLTTRMTVLSFFPSLSLHSFLFFTFPSLPISLNQTQNQNHFPLRLILPHPNYLPIFPRAVARKSWLAPQGFTVVVVTSRKVQGSQFEESLKRNLSRVVLAPWVFLVLMLTASFTAVLTSKVTVSQLVPSAKDIEDLIRENAAIGCNRKSFTCDFLRNVLHVKPENVRNISSIDDYPEAFESGNIKAAIFVTAHAKVFLAEYCRGYKMTGPTYTFGGLGFAFQEGTSLVRDMSVAVLKAIENGEVFEFERQMLHSLNCNASGATTSKLGPRPFSVIFYLSGGVALVALLVTAIPMMVHHCKEALEKVKRFLWVHLLLIRSCSRPIIELAMQSSVGAQA